MASPDRWRQPQIRGGYRCGLCNITYPNDREKFLHCIACGDRTSYMSGAKPDDDWVDKAAELVQRWEGGDHDTFPTDWLIPPPKKTEGEGETGTQGSA